MAILGIHEIIESALADARQTLPPTPRITRILHRFGKDQDGDDAVFVTVVLDDRTPKEQYNWQHLGPIYRRFADAAKQAYQFQIEAIPYVRFVRETQARREGLYAP